LRRQPDRSRFAPDAGGQKQAGLTVCFSPAKICPVTAPSRQADRSAATRARLLDATIGALVELGWAGTTTTVVAERAGVSRGAQLHHYPTRADLVLAAVDHLGTRRAEEVRREAAALPSGRDRTYRVLELLADFSTGPLYMAALEVWVAARTDEVLRTALVPVEARLGRELHRVTVELLGADESRPGVREIVQATLDLVRGLGVANLLTDDSARRQKLLRVWAQNLEGVLHG
jgi:AcrR family transcriptional regulator